MKHSGLLGRFVSYKENEGCETQGPYSQHFIYFVTYEQVK
jgi:hypothetical protein